MKNYPKLFVLLTFLAAGLAFACQTKNEAGKPLSFTKKQTYKSIGVVKKVDADAGKITFDHEEIPGYMAAMEMTEAVSDAKMLEAVKIGDRIEFELQRTDASLLITKINKIGETALVNSSEVYKVNCAECHGATGEGTEKGISFLKGHALKHSEKDFIEQVTNGEGKKMPAFKDKLSAEQIASVVKFVREELQKNASMEKMSEQPQ
jgi:Cu/Ag efflux protein CusF